VIWFHRARRTFGYVAYPAAETMQMLFKRRIQDTNGPTTYVAASTTIVGTIAGKGAYVFCGTVQGDCAIGGPVTLAAGAHWTGTLKASDLVVAGVVEGDVIAQGRVEILGTARVSGSLSGNSIAVAEGAIIEGEIKVTSGAEATTFQEKRQG